MEDGSARSPLKSQPDPKGAARHVTIRAYASLNDFLDRAHRYAKVEHSVDHRTSVKDFIERIGIPHPEVDLLLVNGVPAPFEYLLSNGDHVAVFPSFLHIDIGSVTRVRPATPSPTRFLLDVHLGRLARHLRLAGLDTSYAPSADDDALAATAAAEHRMLLTRDVGLLKRRVVTHGYFVRATEPHAQFVEILRRFSPLPLNPFSRCLRCNGELRPAPKETLAGELLPRTCEHYDEFCRCAVCGRIFWKGTHYTRLTRSLERAIDHAEGNGRT